MNISLRQFFQIPLVKFLVHILILVGFVVNIYQFYRLWDLERQVLAEQNKLQIVSDQGSDAKNQKDYFASELYKEKYSKQELNYKKRGESVIDTAVIENTNELSGTNYIPLDLNQNDSNIERWYKYLFYEQN